MEEEMEMKGEMETEEGREKLRAMAHEKGEVVEVVGEIVREGAQVEEPDGNAHKGEANSEKQQQTSMAAWSGTAWGGRGGERERGGWFHHHTWNLPHHKLRTFNKPGVYGGAIFMCNRKTKQECFQQKLFGLPGFASSFIKKIKAGMLLFLFEYEERKLYGVFEATSDGALNIVPNAFASSGMFQPAQVLFKRVWFCKPLIEAELSCVIKQNFFQTYKFFFGLSHRKVLKLVYLFSSKRIRLHPYQKPIARVIRDYEISLAHTGQESSSQTRSNVCPAHSSNFCNNRSSLPHSLSTYRRSFMYTKRFKPNFKFPAHHCKSPLHPWLKSVMFRTPNIQGNIEQNADYIPLELDDFKSNIDTDLSDMLETVSFSSNSGGSISCEDPKPFDGNYDQDDENDPLVLIPRLQSESDIVRNSVFSHIVKEMESSRQTNGCKRKANLQFDEHSVLLSPEKAWIMTKQELFSSGGREKSVASSDKALNRPAFAELEQNREVAAKGKQKLVCANQNIQKKERDISAKRSKLMSLSPQMRNFTNMSRAALEHPVTGDSSGINLTRALTTDEKWNKNNL